MRHTGIVARVIPITHTIYSSTVLLITHTPPIVCPSNDSQNAIGQTALFMAIQADGYVNDGAAECVALLRAARAE